MAYRYSDYQEDGGRVRVHTQTTHFEATLNPRLALKGDMVYDAISGATPTGRPPEPGSSQVELVRTRDQRYSGNLAAELKYGRTTTTPQLSYGTESDYRSAGFSLNEAVDFNQRNTTLLAGVAHNSDRLKGSFHRDWITKDTTDGLLGVNQLLGPHTYLTVNLTAGYADGYLTDPYKGVKFFADYPAAVAFLDPASFTYGEQRPSHKFRQIAQAGLTHYFEAVQGSLEAGYRFHHDSYGIFSHTAELSWHQKLGRKVMISPQFRYYHQTAARFYGAQFKGDPGLSPEGDRGAVQSDGSILFSHDPTFPGDAVAADVFGVPAPAAFFSSDYRLSRLNTFSYGLTASWRVHDRVSLEAAYLRYEMHGLDGVTSPSAYPRAHIFTIGFGLWF